MKFKTPNDFFEYYSEPINLRKLMLGFIENYSKNPRQDYLCNYVAYTLLKEVQTIHIPGFDTIENEDNDWKFEFNQVQFIKNTYPEDLAFVLKPILSFVPEDEYEKYLMIESYIYDREEHLDEYDDGFDPDTTEGKSVIVRNYQDASGLFKDDHHRLQIVKNWISKFEHETGIVSTND